jgi:hypothetical protein
MVLVYVLGFGGLRWGKAAALTRERCDIRGSRLGDCSVPGRSQLVSSYSESQRPLPVGTLGFPASYPNCLGEHLGAHTRNRADLVFHLPGRRRSATPNFRRRVWRPALDEFAPVLPSGTDASSPATHLRPQPWCAMRPALRLSKTVRPLHSDGDFEHIHASLRR